MKRHTRQNAVFFLTMLLLGISLFFMLGRQFGIAQGSTDEVRAAWQRAQQAGAYEFTGDIEQIVAPNATIENAGRTSQHTRFYIEGKINQPEQLLEMQLWAQTGSVLQPQDSISVRSERGKTMARAGEGAWEEQGGFTELFAPQGDMMAFLVAARDITSHGQETRAGLTFTRVTFTLDGPAFASYMRDQLQQDASVPYGVELQLSDYYQQMQGNGELWVGLDGLPLRQLLYVEYPEHLGETVSANISINFANFAALPSGYIASLFAQRLPDFAPLTMFMFTCMFSVALIRYRSSMVMRKSLAVALSLSLLLGPLLTSLKIHSFFETQAAQAASVEEQREEAEQLRQVQAELNRSDFDPHLDRLASISAAPVVAPAMVTSIKLTEDGTDTDGDGLTDFQEERIGTDHTYADSDEDGLPDTVEVRGASLGGKMWYLDPNEVDTNKDGIGDSQEWDTNNDGIPDDTDGDGIPDAHDDDNDGDGVPDKLDASPFVRLTQQFSEASPFNLALNGLTANRSTFVDFQIRPTDPEHLWFAFNVINWPYDSRGQIRSVDGDTYAMVARQQGRTPEPNDAFGNMKLIPMLEIRVPNNGANLPSQRDLANYNITINNYTANGSTKVVYVPLNVQTDQDTGMRVAFTGRMRYLPTGNWPSAHQVRLAWVVHGLMDMPCDPASPADVQQGCRSDGYIHNVPQVVQTYYDSWTLTGMNVREDHGSSVAIIYEDPAVDPHLKDEPALWALSYGLDSSFIGGRDANGDNQRDVTINEITRRFNRTSNQNVSSNERWDIPNILRVEQKQYTTFDEAIATTAMTETKRILQNQFATPWKADKAIKPLLMYVQEERSRALGLDGLPSSQGYVRQNGTTITFTMQPNGQVKAPVMTTSHLRWAPYCSANGAEPSWQECDTKVWWETLEERSPASVILPEDDPLNTDLAEGRMFVVLLYATQLKHGVSSVVQHDDKLISSKYAKPSDPELASTVRTVFGTGVPLVAKHLSIYLLERILVQKTLLEMLGKFKKDFVNGFKTGVMQIGAYFDTVKAFLQGSALDRLKGSGLIIGVIALTATLVTMTILYIGGNEFAETVVDVVSGIATFVTSIILPIKNIVDMTNKLGSVAKAFGSSVYVTNAARTAGLIVMIISIAVTWGFFIYSMVANDVEAFSPAFNRALAEAIATTIYTILMFAIGYTGIGALIAGIIAVVDFILMKICEAGVEELRNVHGMDGACFTLGTAAIKALTSMIYSYSPMIDLSRRDMLVMGVPQITFADPNKGFVTGNALSVSMALTTTVAHKNPDAGGQILLYPWLFSRDNLRSSSFAYALSGQNSTPISVGLNQMISRWQNVQVYHTQGMKSLYRGQANTSPTPLTGVNLSPGLNRELPLTLNMAYAIPAYECWGRSWMSYCRVRELADSNAIKLNSMYFDILPSTLDGFMALEPKTEPSGRGMSWSPEFRALWDSDGDGLAHTSRHGVDPDDTKPDADGDGLSDAHELQRRSQGIAFNVLACDTDGDGLTDKQEALLGTNPAKRDTDGDGITDADEVWHQVYNTATCQPTNTWSGGWDVVIGGSVPLTVRVSSNPLKVDSDGDGISDLVERTLAQNGDSDQMNRPYHPNVANIPPLAVSLSTNLDNNRALGPGQTFTYTTTALAYLPLLPSPLAIQLPQELGGTTVNTLMPFNSATFTTVQTATHQQSFTVVNNPQTANPSIVSTVTGTPVSGGTIVVSETLSITIDNEPPSSQVTSHEHGDFVLGNMPGHPIELVICGTAEDTKSAIAQVEVSVNGRPWEVANGTNEWCHAIEIDDGEFEISTRATDSVGKVETPTSISIFADGFSPQSNYIHSPSSVVSVVSKRSADGFWTIAIGGVIYDPQIGQYSSIAKKDADGYNIIRAGVGVVEEMVEVRIRPQGDTITINPWQSVTLQQTAINTYHWSATYQFPISVADPTGTHVIDLRGMDKLGNEWINGNTLMLDVSAPIVTLSQHDALRTVISDTITITGLITDENSLVGIDALDVKLVPFAQAQPWSKVILHLPFEEAAGAEFFNDVSGRGNHAACTQPADCPDAGGPGRIDQGLLVGGSPLRIADKPNLNFDSTQNFTVQGWIKTTRGDNVILHKGSGQQRYRLSLLGSGQASFGLWNGGSPTLVTGGPDLRDNQWHYVVGTLDRSTGRASLYVDGVLITSSPVTGDFTNADPLEVAGQTQVPETPQLMDATIDDVAIFSEALSAAEISALYEAADTPWLPATLAQRGTGKATSSWSLVIPAGLEGQYQLNVRSKDMLGNQAIRPNLWRGEIDTQAPRVVLTAQPTGAYYFDSATNRYRAAVAYVCSAHDQHLNAAEFTCPGSNLPQPVSSFSNDPILAQFFPDLTIRSGMVISYTQWQQINAAPVSMRACDEFGNCATASATVSAPAPTPGAPQAVVVAPEQGSIIASSGALGVTVFAEADQPLREITLSLDGTVVNTINLAQADAIKRHQRIVQLTVANEGEHTLVARATDWSGRVQTVLYPVTFTLDKNAPTLTIDTAPLTVASTYGPGSDILRFKGSVNDTIGLASVQISINGGPFADANFGNGAWSTAQSVPNPEGQLLTVTVRATDLAGRVTEVTRTIQVDITTANPVNTTITAKPNNPSHSTSASFSFTGTPGDNSVAAFECKLDNGDYELCASPMQYTNLSKGTHTFTVRAIDSQGYVDPTPATYTWLITDAPQPSTETILYLPVIAVLR